MLDSNVMVNVNDNDDEIIHFVPEFGDAFGFSFVVSNVWVLIYIRMPKRSNLKARKIFSSKNELINVVKR